jgi:O-antigen ligase
VGRGSARGRIADGRLPGALVASGVVAGAFGVSVAMAPGAYNPFGPIKSFVLVAAASLIVAGFALDPAAFLAAVRRVSRLPVAWAAGALVAVAALATAMAADPAQSLLGHYPEYQGLLLLLVSAIVGFGAFAIARREDAWQVVGRAAVVAVLLVCAYALAQFAGFDPVPSLLEFTLRRVRSTLGNASNLGVFLALALPLALARAREYASRAWRTAAWAAAAAGAFVLVASLSRGAWLGAALGAVAWLVVEARTHDRAWRVRVAAIAAAFAVVAAGAAVALVPNVGARLAEVGDPTAGTPAWRVEVWSISTAMVAARPALGYGPASYRYEFPAFRSAATMVGETGVQVLEDPHNVFASAAVAGGVPALLAFAALVALGIVGAGRLAGGRDRKLAGPALTAALVAGLAALQFHFFTLDTAPLFAALLGLAAAYTAPPESEPGATAPATARATAGRAAAPATAAPATARATAGAARATAAAGAPRTAGVALAVLAAALGLAALLAAGLVAADYSLASAFAAADAGTPWPPAAATLDTARSLAPWEPALDWAKGRAAARWMSVTGDVSSFPDARAAFAAAYSRLPADPLLVAQTAEAYLVAGLESKDAAVLTEALTFADRAVTADPRNGFRWGTKGAILAALGDSTGALDALLRAVQYAPNDPQAWANLASVYRREGDTARAANAQARADALLKGVGQ